MTFDIRKLVLKHLVLLAKYLVLFFKNIWWFWDLVLAFNLFWSRGRLLDRFVTLKRSILRGTFLNESFECGSHCTHLNRFIDVCGTFWRVGLFFIDCIFVLLKESAKIAAFHFLSSITLSFFGLLLTGSRFTNGSLCFWCHIFLVR